MLSQEREGETLRQVGTRKAVEKKDKTFKPKRRQSSPPPLHRPPRSFPRAPRLRPRRCRPSPPALSGAARTERKRKKRAKRTPGDSVKARTPARRQSKSSTTGRGGGAARACLFESVVVVVVVFLPSERQRGLDERRHCRLRAAFAAAGSPVDSDWSSARRRRPQKEQQKRKKKISRLRRSCGLCLFLLLFLLLLPRCRQAAAPPRPLRQLRRRSPCASARPAGPSERPIARGLPRGAGGAGRLPSAGPRKRPKRRIFFVFVVGDMTWRQ